jgi:hypothetical protein
MVPDANAPPALAHEDAEDHAGPGHGAAAPSMRERSIWRVVSQTVDGVLQDILPDEPGVNLDTVIELTSRVVGDLVTSGVLQEADDDDEPDQQPVLLRCSDRSADWWYRAVCYTMGGPWLPR